MQQTTGQARPRVDSGTILVVGSINMDQIVRCPHLPAPGETLLGSAYRLHPGGKGANSATAAAKLVDRTRSQDVAMIGAVGDDDNGAALRRNLQECGVNVRSVMSIKGVPTGVAFIAVSDAGENSIIVVPGANWRLDPAAVEQALPGIDPQVVLMQMEIPPETVVHSAMQARAAGALVVLDPAPVPSLLSADVLQSVTVLTPNEGELAGLTGMPTETTDEAACAAQSLRSNGAPVVVVKRGQHGALVVDRDGARVIAAPRIDVVDTTGAGDCFDAALAVGLVEGWPIDRVVRFATHAAALACTRLGAQSAQPTREDVRTLLADMWSVGIEQQWVGGGGRSVRG